MTPQIGDTAPDFESATTEVALGTQSSTPKHLLEVIARTTACSSMAGLLAWATLNAQMADASSL